MDKIIITEETARRFNEANQNSLYSNLGIEIIPSDDGAIHATMPVDERTCQLFGYINGGANLALAETVTGLGSVMLVEPDEGVVGMQVNGSHIHAVHVGGSVHAKCTLIHMGKTTHVWDAEMRDSQDRLACVVRVTNFIFKLKDGKRNNLSLKALNE